MVVNVYVIKDRRLKIKDLSIQPRKHLKRRKLYEKGKSKIITIRTEVTELGKKLT